MDTAEATAEAKLPQSTDITSDEKPTIIGYILLLIMLLLASPIIIPFGILIMCIVVFSM